MLGAELPFKERVPLPIQHELVVYISNGIVAKHLRQVGPNSEWFFRLKLVPTRVCDTSFE